MGRLLNALRSLVQVRELGGGSFWRGAAYILVGIALLPFLLLFGWLLLPPIVRQAITLLLAVVVLGIVGYAIAIVYARAQRIIDS